MPCIVDGKIIETPIKDILEFLQQQLYISHIDKLSRIDYKQMNARITCPIHKEGKESTPSCDILLVDKETTDSYGRKIVIPAGTVNCFACGYRANIVKLIADCLDISYNSATKWLLSFVNYSIQENIRDVDIDFNIAEKDKEWSNIKIVTSEELNKYEYTHPYMYKRGLTDFVINKFDIGYDIANKAITFPVYVNGNCLFIARRKVDYKRFDMPIINPKPIYLLDYITEDEVYICESAMDALLIWGWGKQAVCLFGTSSAWQLEQLKKSNIRKFIIALDNDEGGNKGAQRVIKALDNKILTRLNIPKGKDIGDLTKEEFLSLDDSIC